jgi:2-amino-4-hydroxy-6-hydroxymethyldihydropteridine diphosphokinase
MVNRAYLSLGSNLNPEQNLPKAVSLLTAIAQIVEVSPVYETIPVGDPGVSKNYLNAAMIIETDLNPTELKARLVEIETQLGRTRDPAHTHKVPLDLDIVLFNAERHDLRKHQIADRAIYQHAHIVVPLADIAPDVCHPLTGETLKTIAAHVGNAGVKPRPDVTLIK